jgi:hypothetical protein
MLKKIMENTNAKTRKTALISESDLKFLRGVLKHAKKFPVYFAMGSSDEPFLVDCHENSYGGFEDCFALEKYHNHVLQVDSKDVEFIQSSFFDYDYSGGGTWTYFAVKPI